MAELRGQVEAVPVASFDDLLARRQETLNTVNVIETALRGLLRTYRDRKVHVRISGYPTTAGIPHYTDEGALSGYTEIPCYPLIGDEEMKPRQISNGIIHGEPGKRGFQIKISGQDSYYTFHFGSVISLEAISEE